MFSASEFLDGVRSDLDRAHAIPQLGYAMRRMTTEIGLQYSVYFLNAIPDQPNQEPITIATYPLQWVQHYYLRNYLDIDPVISIAANRILPTDWASFGRLSPKVRTMFGEAYEHGIGPQRITIPIRGPRHETAIVCFTSEEKGDG